MVKAFVAIGSNFNPEVNISRSLALLREAFGGLNVSNIYRNKSIKNNESDYLNLVVSFNKELAINETLALSAKSLILMLKDIEHNLGRKAKDKEQGIVAVDLDLILYQGLQGNINGRELPSPDIIKHSFILAPLADIAKDEIDQRSGKSYTTLWEGFDKSVHLLEKMSSITR